jgi:hypothetical protein
MPHGKWKNTYDNNRKYCSSWETELVWVKESPDGTGEAFCKLCKVNILPKYFNLKAHEKTAKHLKHIPKNQPTLKVLSRPRIINLEVKKVEIKLAVSVVCHTSIRAVDHLTDFFCQTCRRKHTE